MRRRLLALAGLVALGGGIAAAVIVARSPSAQHAQPLVTTRPRPAHRAKPKIVRGPHDSPVPILMYHVLSSAPPGAAYPELWVSPADFAAQMNWLAAHGYHAVTLVQLLQYWRRGVALPPRPFVATFDDGYLSDFTVGLPTLRKHDWAGVLNLVVNSVGRSGLGAGQVRALIAAGWEIDAHTVTHADLVGLDPARLRYEVSGSRVRLRAMFHQPVDFFCYPAGHYDAAAIAAVRAAGFLGATTENQGLATPSQPYTLNRIRVDSTDGLSGLVAKMQRYGA